MKDSSTSTGVRIARRETVQLRLEHPSETVLKAQTVPLSILDATTAKFRTTSAIWFYNSPTSPANDVNPISVTQLRASLLKTLSYHPWLTGRLDWAHSAGSPFDTTTHDKRFRRLVVTYNSALTDLGVSFVAATCESHNLSEMIPLPHDRSTGWDPSALGWTSDQFLPDLTTLALYRFPDTEGPCFGVQITTFKCGGVAIGIAIPHQIADALTVTNFMRDWSNMNIAMVKGLPTPELSPCFQPSLLDARATGDIDESPSDPTTVARARELPILRYDRWVDKKGETIIHRLPHELQDKQELLPPHDTAIPWEDWDFTIPSCYRVLHFGRGEIERMYNTAITDTSAHRPDGQSSSSSQPTRHDALLAHVWLCINAARAPLLKDCPTSNVFLTMTMGIRSRLSLPSSFVGSPIMLTSISRPAGSFGDSADNVNTNKVAQTISSIGQIASDIHSTQAIFTASAIGDALHDAAFEIDPNRLWATMLGSRHTLTTSWIHTHTYDDMDFGSGVIPWYVHPAVDKPDGQVIIMEACPGNGATAADKWYHRGVDVGVSLREDVMQRMLSGELLRRWQS